MAYGVLRTSQGKHAGFHGREGKGNVALRPMQDGGHRFVGLVCRHQHLVRREVGGFHPGGIGKVQPPGRVGAAQQQQLQQLLRQLI